jgi:hypothetical protein
VSRISELLAAGRLEIVPADRAVAELRLERASHHLTTAGALIIVDAEVAYNALYDAARKSVTAHMLAYGLRAPSGVGAHEAVGIYAIERIPDATGSVAQYQRLRRTRNRSEYNDFILGRAQIEADLRHATNIVAAVRAALSA